MNKHLSSVNFDIIAKCHNDRTYSDLSDEIFKTALKYHGKHSMTEAIKLYKEAAGLGNIQAKYMLATCYKYGIGVNKNHGLAIVLYKDASK
jgi:TPR repeat protein